MQKLTCHGSARCNGQLFGAIASVLGRWELFPCAEHVMREGYEMHRKYFGWAETYGCSWWWRVQVRTRALSAKWPWSFSRGIWWILSKINVSWWDRNYEDKYIFGLVCQFIIWNLWDFISWNFWNVSKLYFCLIWIHLIYLNPFLISWDIPFLLFM